MSNFEEKFNNWKERMNQKTDKERHNYALTVAFAVTAIVFFFVASNWYFRISGNSFNSSLFTDIENTWNEQKDNFSATGKNFTRQREKFMEILNSASATTSATTSNTN